MRLNTETTILKYEDNYSLNSGLEKFRSMRINQWGGNLYANAIRTVQIMRYCPVKWVGIIDTQKSRALWFLDGFLVNFAQRPALGLFKGFWHNKKKPYTIYKTILST